MAKHVSRDRELVQAIQDFEAMSLDAADAGQFAPAVAARTKAESLRADLARLRDEQAAARERDPLKRIRRLRRRAAEDGSWVAAATLAKQEQELVDRLAAEQERRAEEARKALNDDQLVRDIVADLKQIPEAILVRVREALAAM